MYDRGGETERREQEEDVVEGDGGGGVFFRLVKSTNIFNYSSLCLNGIRPGRRIGPTKVGRKICDCSRGVGPCYDETN